MYRLKSLRTIGLAGLLAIAGISAGDIAARADGTADAIATRQAIMKSFGAHFGGIKAAALAGNNKAVVGNATAVNALSKVLGLYFPKGSGPESGLKTQALATIWTDKAGFDAVLTTLATQSAKLIDVAKGGGDSGAMMAQFGQVGKQGCGGCHRTYRQKKK